MPSNTPNLQAPGNDQGARSSATQARAGLRVGEWVLEQPLGRGSYGEVWMARHNAWADELAAVKLPHDAAFVQMLRREGAVSHRLRHPNIVRAIGADPFAAMPYLATEYVPGQTLRQVLAGGRLDAEAASRVAEQVLLALHHAHSRGVVHRDVKPENVLIHQATLDSGLARAKAGGVKLADFGLVVPQNGSAERADSIVFSVDGGVSGLQAAGSLEYMAPEQRDGMAVDARADLYSVGIMLFEMVVGRRPAGADMPSDLVPDLPAFIDEAFRRTFVHADRRVASAHELLSVLRPRTATPALLVPQATRAEAARAAVPGVGCPSCRGRVDAHDQFCMHCGKQLVAEVRRCGRCAGFPAPDDHYCMFCGNHLVADGEGGVA